LVSHDRHILNQLVTQVVEVGHGSALRYLGNYDEYLEKKASEEAALSVLPVSLAVANSSANGSQPHPQSNLNGASATLRAGGGEARQAPDNDNRRNGSRAPKRP